MQTIKRAMNSDHAPDTTHRIVTHEFKILTPLTPSAETW